ncbi:MAG: galactokinase family protein, partial [Lachnoclostridium sp.]|nr:galactokinase family protein [Lachnoclostridium sp.]
MKNIVTLSNEIKEGHYDSIFKQLYEDESLIIHQKKRYHKALLEYEKIFGEDEAEVYSTPGRSEIGGNHTDHQQGMVLAASINC